MFRNPGQLSKQPDRLSGNQNRLFKWYDRPFKYQNRQFRWLKSQMDRSGNQTDSLDSQDNFTAGSFESHTDFPDSHKIVVGSQVSNDLAQLNFIRKQNYLLQKM